MSWVHTTAGPSAPTLAVADGRVVTSDGASLAALDAGSGVTDWTDAASAADCGGLTQQDATSTAITVDAGAVTGLTALCSSVGTPGANGLSGTADLATGAVTWISGGLLQQHVVANGARYGVALLTTFPNIGERVFFGGSTSYARFSDMSRPAIEGNRAFIANGSSLVAVLLGQPSAGFGTTPAAWTATLTNGGTSPTPSADGSRVYVTDGSSLRAFDQATGAVVWSTTLPAVGSTDAPAVAYGEVFVRTANGIVALDAATGATRWSGSLGTLGTTATGLGSPTVANGVVYVGSQDGKLLAFDAAGTSGCSGSPVVCTPLLSADIGGAPGASRPVPANGSVFIGALHADGNEAVYKFSLPG